MPKKKQLNQNVLIELIDLSCGTQQRLISPAKIAEYADLMKDGVEFPPVELIFNGKDTYYCWDGFQRIAAIEKNGGNYVQANIEIGNLRGARLKSLGANKTHGMPRGEGVKKNCVLTMLHDKEWSEWSVDKIAKHVGCSRRYVYQVKEEVKKNPVICAENDVNTSHSDYSGIIYKDSPANKQVEREPKVPLIDGAANKIPPDLVNRYISRSVLLDFINQLDQIKNQVKNSIDDGNLGYALLNQQGFYADMRNLRNRLKSAVPFAICPYCKGKCCESCHNMGFVNHATWKAAPKDE